MNVSLWYINFNDIILLTAQKANEEKMQALKNQKNKVFLADSLLCEYYQWVSMLN